MGRHCSIPNCGAYAIKGFDTCVWHSDRKLVAERKREREEAEKSINIIEAIESKFRPAFGKDLSTWKNWYSTLKAIYGLEMDSEEEQFYQEHTKRKSVQEGGFSESYFVAGRRSGKSKIAALIATYEGIYGNWEKYLSKGEKAYIFLLCVDKLQSRVLFDYVCGYLESFPEIVKKITAQEIFLNNGIIISIKTASFRGVRGYGCACIVADELNFWRDSETSRNPASEIITALLPTLYPESKLIGLSSPYAKFGYFYQTYKENYGNEESETLVIQAPTKKFNPTYSDRLIERLRKRDPEAWKSEYMAEFRDDVAQYLTEEQLEKVIEKYVFLPRQEGVQYYAFVDPSGGRSDSMTMGICHRDDLAIIVDRIEERCAPISNPRDVVSEFAVILNEYGISQVVGDRFSGNWCSGSFLDHGITYIPAQLDKNRIYVEALGLINLRTVILPDNEKMKNQFMSLERRTRSGGVDTIDHPPGCHDDIANAISGAITIASKQQYLPPQFWDKKMPVYPPKRERENMEDNMRRELGGAKVYKKPSRSWWTGRESEEKIM